MERHKNKRVNYRTKQNKGQQIKKYLAQMGYFLLSDLVV
jgi:hypothetical protein